MQTIRFFSMAAVALMMGACSVEDNAVEEQAQEPANGRIYFSATIAAPNAGGERTRTTYEATSDGTVTAVKWKENDQIALIHQGIKETVQVSAVDEGTGEATITGTITAPSGDEEDVLLVYPAASVDATGSGTGATYNTVYALMGHTQDGTYSYISKWLDARRATGKIIKSGSVGSLKSKPKMVSEIAIWRLNLSDGTNPFPATKVTLKLGGVTIAGTKTLSTATNDIYLCVVPKTLNDIYTAMPGAVFTIEASDGTNNYIYGTTSALSLATNTYYVSNPVTLAGPFTMAAAANDPTNDLGKVICTAGHIHANTSDDATCPATRVAMIAFVGSETGEGTIGYTHGLALAMTDAGGSSFCQWKTSNTDASHTKQSSSSFSSESGLQYNASHNTDDYPAFKAAIANNGTAAPTGCSAWFLPTGYQWNKMITACTNKLGTNNNHRDLRDAFGSRGGTNMTPGIYWSSTEYDATKAWYFDFGSGGSWSYIDKEYSSAIRVRSAIAF